MFLTWATGRIELPSTEMVCGETGCGRRSGGASPMFQVGIWDNSVNKTGKGSALAITCSWRVGDENMVHRKIAYMLQGMQARRKYRAGYGDQNAGLAVGEFLEEECFRERKQFKCTKTDSSFQALLGALNREECVEQSNSWGGEEIRWAKGPGLVGPGRPI